MSYHVARNSQQLGTFLKEEVIARYNAGAILPTDLVWTEGMATWEPASKIFGAPAAAASADAANVAPPPVVPPPPPVTGVATPVTTIPSDSRPPKPDNYLVWSILATLLCCLPLGIVAIVFAAQVDGKYGAGDYEGAAAAANKAKTFSIVSAVVGLVVAAIYIIVMVFAAAAGNAGRY